MKYICPMCGAELRELPGQQMNPRDGVTLYCANEKCPAQEVMGHGNNAAAAFYVIKEKFSRRG